MFRLVQAMLDYDEAFLNWRYTHMRLAFRVIGSKVMSLKNVPAAQLEQGTREPLFPGAVGNDQRADGRVQAELLMSGSCVVVESHRVCHNGTPSTRRTTRLDASVSLSRSRVSNGRVVRK